MKVKIGKWYGFLELIPSTDKDEVHITISVPSGAFHCEEEAFAGLKDDFGFSRRTKKRSKSAGADDRNRTHRYVS
jgi:hypothetical protein